MTQVDNDALERDTDARTLFGDENADQYVTPIHKYDADFIATPKVIETFPDLQNGPSSLIKGSPVKIQHVGIHNFRLPLTYAVKDGESLQLETSVTGLVSLEAEKKGINMSRIMRTFYEHKDNPFIISYIEKVLHDYKSKLESFEARICLKFSYPIKQPSLRSGLEGYQYYDVVFEVDIDKNDKITKIIHFDYVYSSSCPCSYELTEHARKYRNRAGVPHSQRSTARISIKFGDDFIWIEELKAICDAALHTETQVMVKREDEQAFAELNGSYTKFVEDAVRLMHEKLNADVRIFDFKVVASHMESLHSHDAVSVIVKDVPGGFTADTPREIFNTLYHVPR
jgi:GTP cyclohydrolase I